MTLTLDLPPDLQRQLAQEAARRGQSVDDCVRTLLEERLAVTASAREDPDGQQPASPDRAPSDLFEALDLLLERSDEFDEDFAAPTPSAIDAARTLVSATYSQEPRVRSLRPAFSTMGDGSLYLSWKVDGREVRVLVPPDERAPVRLYYRDARSDGVDGGVTSAVLAQRLCWLSAG